MAAEYSLAPERVLVRWVGLDKPSKSDTALNELIEDAISLLENTLSFDIAAVIAEKPKIERLFERTISEAVIRAWKVGQEYRSQYSETIGAFSQSASIGVGADAHSGRGLYFTDSELSILRVNAKKRSRGVVQGFSMAPQNSSHYGLGGEWGEL